MSIERFDFDSIAENDLQELVDAQVPEGLKIEFKLTNYGNSDADKRELLKDVSALANSHGGHLVLGIEESEGYAFKLVGMEIDPDTEILRMEQILRSAIEPPIPGIRIRSITLISGRKVLLLRIPRSWYPPHRITSQGINKFFIRHSAGVHEPSVEELRTLFNQSESVLEKAQRFRDERLLLVCNGDGSRPLEAEGRFFLHIVPAAAFSGMVQLDVEQIYSKYTNFIPIGYDGVLRRYNYYGFINEWDLDKNFGYTQIFRNGCLEAAKANIVRQIDNRLVIPGLGLETDLFKRLDSYFCGLRDIGVPTPLIIMLTFEGVQGAEYAVFDRSDYQFPLPESVLKLPVCILEEYGTDLDRHRAVLPAFNALWNAIGYPRAKFFNEEGRWVGEKK